ncbi:hypothetical protein ACFL02_05890 [Planctomycetota bacterium]
MKTLAGRKRLFFCIAVLPAGIALVLYGAIFHSVVVFEKGATAAEVDVAGQKSQTVSELDINLEATRDGVVRLVSGDLQSTRAPGEAPAEFCPT